MDPLRIAVRAVCTFVSVLLLIRMCGKRTVRQRDLSSFIVAIVIGDLFDDVFWAEVPASAFVVAVVTLVTVHLAAETARADSGRRDWWRRAIGAKTR